MTVHTPAYGRATPHRVSEHNRNVMTRTPNV